MCNPLVMSSYTPFLFNDVLQCVILALSLSNPQEDGKQKRTTKQEMSISMQEQELH